MSRLFLRIKFISFILLAHFGATSAYGGGDGYQDYVALHFNGEFATCDYGAKKIKFKDLNGGYSWEDCCWQMVHNPELDHSGAFSGDRLLVPLGGSTVFFTPSRQPLQFKDSIIFSGHGFSCGKYHTPEEIKTLKRLPCWQNKILWPFHRELYIDGVGDIKSLAGQVRLAGKLNKDCAIIISACHGPRIGAALSRKLNGWDARTRLTEGVIGPEGGLMSKLILVQNNPTSTGSTPYRFASPVPGSWKEEKFNQSRRSNICQPTRGVSRPITAGKIFSPLAKGALGAHNVRGWIEDPKGSLVSEVATRGAIAVASGPGIIPASFAAIGSCSMGGQAGVRILYQHAVEEIPDVKHAFELLNKNARPTDGREMSDEEIEQFYEAMSEP